MINLDMEINLQQYCKITHINIKFGFSYYLYRTYLGLHVCIYYIK